MIDTLACSEATSLAENELGDFQFLVAIIIWCEILSVFNLISKPIHNQNICLLILIFIFLKHRETGFFFPKTLEAAKELAMEMDIHPECHTKHKIKIKNTIDEGTDETSKYLMFHLPGDLTMSGL